MSLVTNVILTCSLCEEEVMSDDGERRESVVPVKWIDERLGDRAGFRERVIDECGGTKCLETNVFCAAFNYLDTEKLIHLVIQAPWREPENVLLLICGQDDERFTVVLNGARRLP